MTKSTDQRPFYRKKRSWILLLIVAPLVAGATLVYVGQQDLQRQLTELQEVGQPINGEQLNEFYAVPDDVEDTTSLWLTAIEAVTTETFQQDVSDLPFLGRAEGPIVGKDWPELDSAREFISDHSAAMTAIRTAATAGGAARFPVDFRAGVNTLLSNTQESRTVARLLTLDAHVSQRDSKDQQVLQDIVDMFALADSLQLEPTFVSQLVRIAIYNIACSTVQDFLPACEWTDQQLATLQSAAAQMNAREAIQLGTTGERAMGLTMINTMPSMVGFRASNKREILRLYELVLKSMNKPWHEAIADQKAISAQMAARTGTLNRFRYALVSTLFPACHQLAEAGARSTAKQMCTIAALAAQRHRLVHGDFPQSLAQIATEHLPAEVANAEWIDPFTGRPLRHIQSESGLKIYSIGQDTVDDEGDILPKEDGNPTDVGFFLKR